MKTNSYYFALYRTFVKAWKTYITERALCIIIVIDVSRLSDIHVIIQLDLMIYMVDHVEFHEFKINLLVSDR